MSDLNILFCPDELLAQFKKPLNLPLHGGRKAFAPDSNNEEEDTVLNSMLREQRDVLKEQRIHKKGNLSVGNWKPDERVVEVSTAKGSHWQHFGQRKDGKMILQPQEALFLLEQGSLELYHGGIPMSFQQGYMFMLSDDFPPDHYQVYTYFLRLGFIALLHSPRKKRSANSHGKNTNQQEGDQKEKTSSVDHVSNDNGGDKPVISHPISHLWTSEDGVTPLVRPEEATSTERNVPQTVKEKTQINRKKRKKRTHPEVDHVSIDNGGDKPVISSPVSHLWTSEDGVTPLVRPEEATSTAAVLSKLQVIKNQRMTEVDLVESSDHQSLRIAFDVYQPGLNFKKTDPGPPDFCITVFRCCDPPPSLAALTFLSQQCFPVPLKIALVDGGYISFYSVLDVDSPTFITKH